ncbi:MAG: 3-keto-5-aminohexanoate cleavage protein [Candidatus Latescibacteria bacterium]|nr:3-keto-5-aminohexanoate cleavage protein [Candidatus Latescibacterota bacterium]NIO56177.1 3-keto-5-aminohexanoate cleavage protein [Candidatus Latescibacterota bacterium]
MSKKFILNFTPTGMIPTKEMTKAVPIQTDEIIEQVTEAADIGVNMVHIHARDPNTGEPTYKKEIYGEIIGGIKKKHKDLVLCVSLSGRTFPELEKRSEPLDLTGDVKPDFGSLTLSSLNFPKQASINSPEMVQALAKKMLDKGIRPELEAFDLGMVNYAHYLINKKLVKPPYYFNLILGNIASAQSNLMTFGLMVNELPKDSIWSGGGIGKFQLSMNAMSIIAGGGVRIGLEDNIYFDEEKTHLATNKELIERLLLIAKALGRTPYSHKETREVLGLN